LNNWNISKVKRMENMFRNATSFNQSLGDWDVSNVFSMKNMFKGVILSSENYNDILKKWSKLILRKNVKFHAGKSKYSPSVQTDRNRLINKFLWTIHDGGEV